MIATSDQWMQFHQQPPLMDGMATLATPIQGSLETSNVTMSPTKSPEGIFSPINSYNTNGHLTPKGNSFKPIKKRSRASKRTPTTLLNADSNNFRALVQQFTGCPSTVMSFGVHKGPITLNFQQGSKQKIHHHTTRSMPPFGTRSSNQVHQVAASLPWQEQPPLMQEQQSGYSLDRVKSYNYKPCMEVSHDGLLMDNDFSLHELTVNAFSNDIYNKDSFFM
ncbi:uncharacterized protein LOC133291729 [Gastrolobium bilobum]|uniref:uncharacterized protein LOC133291729 n=1 Tax=Gastrolobium bilobum TaxID=150636 RepID=UPI002AB222DE|nr:uncharacterized protein LOC133291729 [Gastrolobium bilobum]